MRRRRRWISIPCYSRGIVLGDVWLIGKTEDALQDWLYEATMPLALAVLAAVVIVSLWTPFAQPTIAARWFSMPQFLVLMPIPLITAALGLALLLSIRNRKERLVFPIAVGLFLLAYLGLAVSLWPYIIPREVTIWEAAAPPETQIFLLVGVLLFLPLVLAYTLYTYRTFRGKVRSEEASY